ncbi:MAG TPA: hypothetical protein VK947_01745 [Planococcus sp. (in: firmicutes)]|nr:hypothetical protein [Planococcus sp. (in: firmicutes)]
MKTLLRILLILILIGIIAILLNIYNTTSAQEEILEEKSFVVETGSSEANMVIFQSAVLPAL